MAKPSCRFLYVAVTLFIVAACLPLSTALAQTPRLGLVLGGGGARGFAHLGVLQELERHRIPVACIAGTSAGALIGGAYASGNSTERLADTFKNANWDTLLSGKPDRKDMPYRHKQFDSLNYFDLSFGMRNGNFRLPRGAINSQSIDLFIKELTQSRQETDFNHLPIPFRAIATDMETGDAIMFDRGDLSLAMRASMAVPGLFDLVDYQGKLLADGGLARQLPIQELQAANCADVLLVVDVGSPAKRGEELRNFLNVIEQTTYLIVARNSREQRALMHNDDIFLQPLLDGFLTTDFGENEKIAQAGREAMTKIIPQLSRFSVSEAEYQAWQRQKKPTRANRIDNVEVAGDLSFINPVSLKQKLTGTQNALTLAAFHERLTNAFAEGDIERLRYETLFEEGRNTAKITAEERFIGPNYLRIGLTLDSASNGRSSFALLAEHRRSWLNQTGGSITNRLRLGEAPYFSSSWYQPLQTDSPYFMQLSASQNKHLYALYTPDHRREAEFSFVTRQLSLDFGHDFQQYGAIHGGIFQKHNSLQLQTGPSDLYSNSKERVRTQGISFGMNYDQQDNPRWPRQGTQAQLSIAIPHGLAHSERYRTANATLDTADTQTNDITLRGTIRFDGSFGDGDGMIYPLGGMNQLSGYLPGELLGTKAALIRGMAYWRAAGLPSALGSGFYTGISLEAGKVWNPIWPTQNNDWRYGGTLFLGADTLLGPWTIGIGNSKGGRWSGYFSLGAQY